MNQPSLDLVVLTARELERLNPEYPKGFWRWLDDNEHIYTEFVAMARKARQKGFSTWSARAICEVVRWQTALRDGYSHSTKLNDHATPGLARLAMAEHQDLRGFFNTRLPPGTAEARRIDGTLYCDE